MRLESRFEHGIESDDHVLAFDLGGSHVTAWSSIVRPSAGLIRIELDHRSSSEAIVAAILRAGSMALLCAQSEAASPVGVALSVPGPFDYERGVSRMKHKFVALYGLDLRATLAIEMNRHPGTILFINDADAFLLGELKRYPSRRAIAVTLGTGIGSAFAVDGRTVQAGTGVPPNGELYCLPWNGGIVEDAISTRGILALHRQLGGACKTVQEIAQQATCDAIASETMHQFGEALGRVLNAVCSRFEPDIIILGGSIARSSHLFLRGLGATFQQDGARMVISEALDSAAVEGAKAAWDQSSANYRSRPRAASVYL